MSTIRIQGLIVPLMDWLASVLATYSLLGRTDCGGLQDWKEACLRARGWWWKTVPICSPCSILFISCEDVDLQITVLQPAEVAMRAAVSFVLMPPVPHSVPPVSVSTCQSNSLNRLIWRHVISTF